MLGWRRTLLRVVVIWLVSSLSLAFLSALFQGFQIDNWRSILAMSAVLGLLNVFIWPALINIALPLTILTLGFGVILLNGVVVLAASHVSTQSIHINDFATAIWVAFGVGILNNIIYGFLAVNDDNYFHLAVVNRYMKRHGQQQTSEVPGVLFLEIDGLARDVLKNALKNGDAPTMASWIKDRGYKLASWETDWSSQTGAMQAGILHGNNDDMPAFRWWEKEKNRAMVSNHYKDAAEIERRHSDGQGLLADGGASRANLLSGDAPYSLLTMSKLLTDRQRRLGEDYYAYFSNPYNLLRTIALFIQELAIEYWQAWIQKRHDVLPRVHRGFTYGFLRAWTTVIQRDLQVQALIGDMLAGRQVAYTTFLGYDEVAHHSGIERTDSLAVLRRIDREFRRLDQARKYAPRPYYIVVLSDHGQTQGATYLQRSGQSLEQKVSDFTDADLENYGGLGDEGKVVLDASVQEISQSYGFLGSVARGIKRLSRQSTTEAGDAPIKVMASGCLGLIYFTEIEGRASLEEINKKYPKLIKALAADPAIGFLLINSQRHGPVVLGKHGHIILKTGKITGKNPLAPYTPNAVLHLARTSKFKHCADIMINSTYWPHINEVAAFEELVGSHGGLGGTQNYPFILYPKEFKFPDKPIVGAQNVHKLFKNWLAGVSG